MGITENLSSNIEAKTKHGEIPVHYLYTYGVAGDRFFREVKENGVFVATRCDGCGITYLPPRIYCPRCMSRLTSYIKTGIRGKISTFTICHQDVEGRNLPEPIVLAMVGIDGTDGGLIHRVGGTSSDKIKIGMAVEAVFREAKDRQGTIEDITHFRPL